MKKEFKKAKINGLEIPVIIDNRALIDYKRAHGSLECKDMEELLLLTFYGIRSGARVANCEFKMDFEQFIDYTSDHADCLPPEEPAEAAEDDKKKQSTT